MPDAYNGETGTRWVAHFDSVAQVNNWDGPTRLLWLQVRLTGKAQTAWERLDQSAKLTYDTAKAAFENDLNPAANEICTSPSSRPERGHAISRNGTS